jgi:hypothetical protein
VTPTRTRSKRIALAGVSGILLLTLAGVSFLWGKRVGERDKPTQLYILPAEPAPDSDWEVEI